MKSICVYCGSNPGNKLDYAQQAKVLGQSIANNGLRLIYGGGNVGLMGIVANAVLHAGGKVTGVIPQQLVDWEVGHTELNNNDSSQLEVVDSMHQRKQRMFELANGFVALPGGFGTMEEIFEMLTWRQLGINDKPCAFLNIAGYYDALIVMIDHMIEEGFLHPEQRDDLWFGDDINSMMEWMSNYQPAQASKWNEEKRQKNLN